MLCRYIDGCDCGQGLLLVIRNESDRKLCILCSDCYYVWSDPEAFYSGKAAVCEGFNMDIDPNVSKEEIIKLGWDKYVKNMDNPIDI